MIKADQPHAPDISNHPHCEPDPSDPQGMKCYSNITGDGRQCISHFFGRNKQATATIPTDLYPVLCRVHNQEKQYRWKKHPKDMASFQCNAILLTLDRMSKKTFHHSEIDWPWWCGFELPLIKQASLSDDNVPSTSKKGKTPMPKARTQKADPDCRSARLAAEPMHQVSFRQSRIRAPWRSQWRSIQHDSSC